MVVKKTCEKVRVKKVYCKKCACAKCSCNAVYGGARFQAGIQSMGNCGRVRKMRAKAPVVTNWLARSMSGAM